jgi:hypothetical protein
MNFDDEDYVRLYTRDTITWLTLSWQARTVLLHMLRGKFDRSGVFVTGRHGPSRAVTAATGLPDEVVEPGLAELLAEEVWVAGDGCLVWPTFVQAQTAVRSDKARQRDQRLRNAAKAAAVTRRHAPSRAVTDSHETSHAASRAVTQRHPNLAEQNREEDPPSPLPDERPTPHDPMAYLSCGTPQQRPDVVRVFRAFVEAVGQPNRKLRPPGYECPDAAALVAALDTYGLEDCLAVAREAPRDGMVNGSDDDKRQRHDTVRYVFGNPDAFARILRAAKQRLEPRSRHGGKTIAQITAEAKALGSEQ